MRYYAAMRTGLLVGGRTAWNEIDRFGGAHLECVDAHPDRPTHAYVGTFSTGLWRTTDGGTEWNRIGTETIDADEPDAQTQRRGLDPGDVSVMSVAVSPTNPDEVWVGTEPSALFRSSDGGDSWRLVDDLSAFSSIGEWGFPPRPYTHHVRWLEVDPRDPERVYVAIEAGALLVTPDGGENWIERPEGARRDNHALDTHPDAPGRVYSAAGDGYAESVDGGRRWSHPQTGLDHRYVWSVAVDPGDPDRVLVGSASGPREAHNASMARSFVYRSTGGHADRRWEPIDGLPTGEGVTRPVLTGAGPTGTFHALSNRGLYRTDDAGQTWDQLDVPWPGRFEDTTARGLAVV